MNPTTVTMPLRAITATVPHWASPATMLLPTVTPRRPAGPRPVLLPIVAAMATALLGLGPNFAAPILSADTAARHTTTATPPPAPVGPSCGPGATPAGHSPPRRVGLAVGERGIVPAGWIRWCTGAPGNFRVGTVWLAIQLDRATAAASDACQQHNCQITIAMHIPTQSPYGRLYHGQIDTTGPPQATITVTTTSLTLGHHDFAEAYAADPWMYITRVYTESV